MKLILGTAQFSNNYGVSSVKGQTNFQEIKKILSFAKSKKINFLDTAPSYGKSEKIIGTLNSSDFKIIGKTRHFNGMKITYDHIEILKQDFYSSLKNLQIENFYGFLIHNADDLLKPGAEKLFLHLKKIKKEKKILKLGLSVYNQKQLEFGIENFDIDLIQLPFNILDRRMIENQILDKLKKKKIEVHARSIFLQGLLLMLDKERPKFFDNWNNLWKIWHEWLNDNRLTALEATIKYVISEPNISKCLIGVETKKQLEEILKISPDALPKIPAELFSNDINLLNPSNWQI